MMKRILKCLFTAFLAVLMAAQIPIHTLAEAAEKGNDGKYISEIRLGIGKNAAEAEAALEGYEILKDAGGKNVDLNRDAGTNNLGGKGNRVVYLGFIRTTDDKDAVTDLALMNMKGGYKTQDYDALMDDYIAGQILPFVESFLVAIEEYRANCASSNPKNKARADYYHALLNKMTDDDCGGAGLGDLLLNETVYELAKPAYDALSEEDKEKTSFYSVNKMVRDALPEEERNQRADIMTIIAQSNGKATISLANLLTRASDTNEDTWLDRLALSSYDDLLDELIDETGLTKTKAKKELAKRYDDAARAISDMWEDFSADLADYDKYVKILNTYNDAEVEKKEKTFVGLEDDASDEKVDEALEGHYEAMDSMVEYIKASGAVTAHDALAKIGYDGGTMLDFFLTPVEEIDSDLTALYPIVASLTAGQKAGLDYVTLTDLVLAAVTDEQGYAKEEIAGSKTISVYDGVDRGIYEKGAVGLTSDALRTDALTKNNGENSVLSNWTIAFIGLSAASAVAALGTGIASVAYKAGARVINDRMWGSGSHEVNEMWRQKYFVRENWYHSDWGGGKMIRGSDTYLDEVYKARSSMCSKLAIGLGVVVIILTSISIYMTYRDMKNRYNVDYTPIPRYMVDENDITLYFTDGTKKTVLKNQEVYYKAALCNRKEGDQWYKELGEIGDLNGTVGREWLALYAEKNELKRPILADSLFVTNDTKIPAGYENGIHMFGSYTAFNLNSALYCWNGGAPEIYVYFKPDTAPAGVSGSVFSPGTAAIFGFGGVAAGALATALIMTLVGKKKKNPAAA